VHPPDSERQQAAVMAIADRDAFNWGYDPVHWGVPEGSYSEAPSSTSRVGGSHESHTPCRGPAGVVLLAAPASRPSHRAMLSGCGAA
jgi:hypothetical protein